MARSADDMDGARVNLVNIFRLRGTISGPNGGREADREYRDSLSLEYPTMGSRLGPLSP